MIALASSEERTVLLLLPSRKEIYPLNTAAFSRAQNSRRNIARDYCDALIFEAEGGVRNIERIDILGPLGESRVEKLISRLNSTWSIKVKLSEPVPYSLHELRKLLIECLESPISADNFDIGEKNEFDLLIQSLKSASSKSDLFNAFRLPDPKDSLDVL